MYKKRRDRKKGRKGKEFCLVCWTGRFRDSVCQSVECWSVGLAVWGGILREGGSWGRGQVRDLIHLNKKKFKASVFFLAPDVEVLRT